MDVQEPALIALCQQFAPLVRKYVRRYRAVEDVEAEAWLAVVHAIKTYDELLGGHLPGYVESRVKYAILNLFKRERRYWQHAVLSKPDDGLIILDIDVESFIEAKLETATAIEAIKALPLRQQEVILQVLMEGKSLRQVGREMGITTQAVKKLRERGLNRLKKYLDGMYLSENASKKGILTS